MSKLNDRQKAFADYYIESLNAFESAIKAGYSEKYAKSRSYELLENVGIKKYIDERMEQFKSKRIAKAEEVLEYLTKGMRQELEEEVVVMVSTGDFINEPQIIKKKISIKDSNKCAELLGKRYSLFTEKVDLEANVGVTIVDDIGSLEDE